MTWQDRDYLDEEYSNRTSLWAGIRRPPRTTFGLMVIHGAAFVVLLALELSGRPLAAELALGGTSNTSRLGIALHPFAGTSILTAAFVVFALWSLAGRLERREGAVRLLGTYLVANLLAGVAYFALAQPLPSLAVAPLDYPVEALVALLILNWPELRHEPTQIFGRVTSLGKVYFVIAAISVGFVVVFALAGAVAWLTAALAGAAGARLSEDVPALLRLRRGRRRVRPSIPRTPPPEEIDVDDILAKISQSGMAALSRRDRKRLEEARIAKLQNSTHGKVL